jgi:hypothetical protein
MADQRADTVRAVLLQWDAPAPPLEGGDWGFAEDPDDGRMGESGGLGDGPEAGTLGPHLEDQ